MAKTKRPRLPQVSWRGVEHDTHGNPQWDSMDGMIRLRKSFRVDGVSLPVEWQVWRWVGGRWYKHQTFRSEAKARKAARVLEATLDLTEDDE